MTFKLIKCSSVLFYQEKLEHQIENSLLQLFTVASSYIYHEIDFCIIIKQSILYLPYCFSEKVLLSFFKQDPSPPTFITSAKEVMFSRLPEAIVNKITQKLMDRF